MQHAHVRPGDGLQVLEAAVGPEAGLREKAIRLTGNRLFPDANLQATILSHAQASLHTLHTGKPAPATPTPLSISIPLLSQYRRDDGVA